MRGKAAIVILILMFALAAGAGAVAAKLAARSSSEAGEIKVTRGTLAQTLQLRPDQSAAMQQIWEKARNASHDCLAQAQQIQRDEETALEELLTEEQKAKLAQLRLQTRSKVAALEARRDGAFKTAVDDTMKILDKTQRQAYEQIIRERLHGLSDPLSSSALN